MKISEQWLREWVELPADVEQLADHLTMLGLEVDDVRPLGHGLEAIVAGRVTAINPHPDADRLQVCEVDAGQAAVLTIVCGAADVRVGGLYPVALPGTRLPGGQKIRRAKVRGVESAGMLCSAAELGLADEAAGLLALEGVAPGEAVAAALSVPDHVIEVSLTPNRADCFSVQGIARDLAARLLTPLQQAPVAEAAISLTEKMPLEVSDSEACPLFTGRVIRNLDATARTPLWMRERLQRSGLRPLQLIVDVTNYVMLELGQPLHAYELSRLQGGIGVRQAEAGESLELLGGQQLKLRGNELLITDARGPIGLAGIMGGAATAVQSATTDIFLESAHFTPASIAGRARQHGLQTDASMRFERGVDPALPLRALQLATELLLQVAGGEAGPISAHGPAGQWPARAAVPLRRDRLAALLGLSLPDARVTALLTALGMSIEETADGWLAVPPSWRFDIEIEEDLIEEVARLHGYDQLPVVTGRQSSRPGPAADNEVQPDRLRMALIDRGWQEVITYSFIAPAEDAMFALDQHPLPLANPISAEMAHMRRSLWPGLLKTLRYNQARQQAHIQIFEYGARFLLQGTDEKQVSVLAGVLCGNALPEHWSGEGRRPADFFDLKADLEALLAISGSLADYRFMADQHPALHPGRCARIWRDGQPQGWLGELHPALVAELELDGSPLLFELETAGLGRTAGRSVQPVSRFPATRRDLAVLVGREVPVGDLVAAVSSAVGELLTELIVFDVYTGKNIDSSQKSVALGLILQETSRTLTDQDVAQALSRAMDALNQGFNARIRE